MLVVTAKHCVFSSSSGVDAPVPATQIQLGFGTQVNDAALRRVLSVDWIGMPGALSVADAVASGEDIAVLHLAEAAPVNETVRDVVLRFAPTNDQTVMVGGFGVGDLTTGASGFRGVAPGTVTGFDPATGITEIGGAPVCFGDSGGPVLSSDGAAIIGVMSEIGQGDGGYCDSALSFADTAANGNVMRFLEQECAMAGGCGARGLSDADVGDSGQGLLPLSEADDGAAPLSEADDGTAPLSEADDGAAPLSEADASFAHESGAAGGGCAIETSRPSHSPLARIVYLGLAAILGLRRRRRYEGQRLRGGYTT